MKVAFITPVSLLGQYAIRSDYHLMLAHVALAHKTYRDFYAAVSRMGDIVILDNGAYELGQGLDAKTLRKLAEYVTPDIVVLPDMRFDRGKTYVQALNAIPVLKDSRWKLMAVPQAPRGDEEAYFKAFEELSDLPSVGAIGIYPEVGDHLLSGREMILSELEQLGLIREGMTYHALGMRSTVEVRTLQRYKWLTGVDSAKPIVAGLAGIHIHPDTGMVQPYPGRPTGYFEIEDDPHPDIVSANISTVLHLANGGSPCR